MMNKNIFHKPLGRVVLTGMFFSMCFVTNGLAQNTDMPNIGLDFPLRNSAEPNALNGQKQSGGSLNLSARLTETGKEISNGMVWRIYQPTVGEDNIVPLVASSKGGGAQFNLKPGDYVIHASFGQAAIVRRVSLSSGQQVSENLVLDAGGLKLNAIMHEGAINMAYLNFKIYSDDSENDDTALILSSVSPDTITRLKAGTYHIVSNYGSANAISRSDIRVDAGKVTEVTMQHHAAQMTLKLVRQEGGEALADTSWSITTDSGDIVLETVGAYVSLVLAEGDYVAIAKNKDQIYQKPFSVSSGQDDNVDVVANSQNQQSLNDELD